MQKVLVIGSSNIDMVMHLSALPRPGETIGNGTFNIFNGGKGANQAVAAARAGAATTFISCIGKDVFSKGLIENFQADGIQTDYIFEIEKIPTGTALIMVNEAAENCIGVAPGANGALSKEHIDKALPALKAASLIVLQFEIPMPTVEYILETAVALGKKVLVNPAPAARLSDDLLRNIHLLVLNETEAEVLTRITVEDDNLDQVAGFLLQKGVSNVILTLGTKGAFVANASVREKMPAFSVQAVDTTAAGDVFCGALAATLSDDKNLIEAARFASAAAAISVTRHGAQPSAPTKAEIEDFLQKHTLS